MIQIIDKNEVNTYYFPRNSAESIDTLNLYSELTHISHSFSISGFGDSQMYYILELDFSNIPDGEYKYTLENDSVVIESGELRVGTDCVGDVYYGYKETYVTFNPCTGTEEEVEYTDCEEEAQRAYQRGKAAQAEEDEAKLTTVSLSANGTYNADYGFKEVTVNVIPEEINLEEKAVSLSAETITIVPDADYDGLSKVIISAGTYGQTMYASGITAQEAADEAKLTTVSLSANGVYDASYGFKRVTVNVPSTMVDNYILYTTTDGVAIDLNNATSAATNSYNSGIGLITDYDLAKGSYDKGAFQGNTTLKNVVIGSGYTGTGGESFRGCTGLENVTILEGMKVISTSSFRDDTSLTGVTLPSTITTVQASAFQGCSALTYIYIDAETAPSVDSTSFEGVAEVGTLIYPDGADYSTWFAVLPEGWSSMKYYLKYKSSDDEVITPNVLTGWGASIVSNTYKSGYGYLVFDSSFTTIPATAFQNQSRLKELYVPSGVTMEYKYCCEPLAGCSLDYLEIDCGDSITWSAMGNPSYVKHLYVNGTVLSESIMQLTGTTNYWGYIEFGDKLESTASSVKVRGHAIKFHSNPTISNTSFFGPYQNDSYATRYPVIYVLSEYATEMTTKIYNHGGKNATISIYDE